VIRSALRSPCAAPDQVIDFQLHQPIRGKADHLAQQISIGALLQERLKAHHFVGHRRVLGPR